jgi:hypothetical protein
MDVFHFWKDFDADLRAGRIGSFKSSAERLKEFNEGSPNYIWAFRTPKGRKGELQLLARLVWNDRASTGAVIGYDPTHRDSVLYQDPDGTAIPVVTDWVSRNFHRMKLANFQGASGQAAIRGAALNELRTIASRLPTLPLPVKPAQAAA